MKYSWASITKSCENYGNLQIEYGLKNALKELNFNQKPDFIFDAFKSTNSATIDKINQTDFLIVPGCTTLVLDHYKGLEEVLPKIKVPVFNFGTALSSGYYSEKDLPFYKYYFQPIGTRDPFSHQYLIDHNFQSKFIGCPTLFSGSAEKYIHRNNNKVCFLFGSRELEKQIKILDYLNTNFDTTVIIQQENQMRFIENNNYKYVIYNPENIEKEFSNSRLVVTGRLHGALPALAMGVPIFFLNTRNDSRFSLLDYLNIDMFSLEDEKLIDKLQDQYNNFSYCKESTFSNIIALRNKFKDYIKFFIKTINS